MTRSIKRGYRWPPMSAKDRMPRPYSKLDAFIRQAGLTSDALLEFAREVAQVAEGWLKEFAAAVGDLAPYIAEPPQEE